ncbi:hydroxyacyl-coenzyme A dehydrogenase, mitochondrial-like isoform X2 [Topomyia yanbarensis]|uniref:hydroxyacyl-coenzyme A dehydrogenase, mitochondrial-like isoform X2 n=1 Tax=Topomyia yanbarensis TaxID=2498891 RepID=UPI00273B87DE|nr:hydroxyacyl-coenzyme A dehydrogenase, mitochondrial-like isoform X2 [Topomyia yanbarensis]
MTSPIKNVVVAGAGTMGSGIAMVAAATGHTVTLVDMSQQILDKSRTEIEKNANRFARKFFKDDPDSAHSLVTEALSRTSYTTNLEDAISSADLVIEAIVENMEIKKDFFRRIDDIAPPHVIFVSNTSSLSISEMSAITKREDRFAGFHFFNPVPLMKLIELIRTDKTSDETYTALLAFGRALGKTCINCKDTPGFIVNRLLFTLTSEALQMLERGDATARDIDTATKLGLGHPMGPFELMDMVGLDVSLNIMQERQVRFPNDPKNVPSPILEKMVSENKLGVKSGEGFYNYK